MANVLQPNGDLRRYLAKAYGVVPASLVQLPWGADGDTAVFQLTSNNSQSYFLKLRKGIFHLPSVTLPNWLAAQGLAQIIPTQPTLAEQPVGSLNSRTVLLYPFVIGENGYERRLTPKQWQQFGTAIRLLHSAAYPKEMIQAIPKESFSNKMRKRLAKQLARLEAESFHEPLAKKTAAFLWQKRPIITHLISQASNIAHQLKTLELPFVVCHADLHAGNLHLSPSGDLFVVDWDTLIRAPKERDLMYIGGGLLGHHYSFAEEGKLFFAGYGATTVNKTAVSYYRTERIIEDLAIYAEELLHNNPKSDEDQQSFHYLASNFLPGHTLEAAAQKEDEII